ncbi:MAG: CidA/LrgA family protein [Candidatus Gastranaerophilales bacterium]|nr:CidA/LrgA family protein [Candidatus Gastranaerophilales bacterium]
MFKTTSKFLLGLGILFMFYILSLFIIKLLHIAIPPAILGLVLFAIALINGIIKEEWIKLTSEFFLKYMAVLFVPFIVGVIVYKSVILKNWLAIILVVLLTTTITIVLTGLFVEYGIKYLRLHKMRKYRD